MTNADKMRLIGIAGREHRSAGGSLWSPSFDIAVFDAGYAAALAEAAATVDAMITSPTDIILCADTIDEAAARIRRLGAK